jgi:hypothetical protein
VPDPIERWTIQSLRPLVVNTSEATWRRVLVPTLIARGVLVKHGKAWLGRRSEIEAALLNPSASTRGAS